MTKVLIHCVTVLWMELLWKLIIPRFLLGKTTALVYHSAKHNERSGITVGQFWHFASTHFCKYEIFVWMKFCSRYTNSLETTFNSIYDWTLRCSNCLCHACQSLIELTSIFKITVKMSGNHPGQQCFFRLTSPVSHISLFSFKVIQNLQEVIQCAKIWLPTLQRFNQTQCPRCWWWELINIVLFCTLLINFLRHWITGFTGCSLNSIHLLTLFYLLYLQCTDNYFSLFGFAGDNIGWADLLGQTLQNANPVEQYFLNECCKCVYTLFGSISCV